jgi:hypothetical protein
MPLAEYDPTTMIRTGRRSWIVALRASCPGFETYLGPLLAMTVCLAVYWPGLTAWFQRDDFAWLGLGWETSHGLPWTTALFKPMTEGTVRVLSERLYFVLFYHLFALNPLPFRLLVFVTQAVNLFLLASLARRLTGSVVVAAGAACLWTVNTALAVPMVWSSAYNQVLCAFFVLASLRLLFEYLETGRRRYYAAQCLTFLLGFGASEFMIVYPAAAALLVLARDRRLPRTVAVLFLPSMAFAAYHFLVLRPPVTGPYALRLDLRIFSTLGTYWRWSLGPGQMEWDELMSAPLAGWLVLLLTVPLLAFVVGRARRGQFLPLALLAWYPLWLAPVIAIPNHIIEYYPALSAIGLAMLGSWGVWAAWCSRKLYARVAACLLVATYLATSIVASHVAVRWHHEQSDRVRNLVEGVARAEARYPGKTILVAGVDGPLFWAAVFDNPFRLVGASPVYLTPETPDWVRERPETGDVLSRYELPAAVAEAVLAEGRAIRYDAVALPAASATGPNPAAETIDLGNESFSGQLGEGWYQAEGTHRWMAKTAWLSVPRPASPRQKLHIEGYVPAFLLARGPVRLSVTADGQLLGTSGLDRPDASFAAEFTLPEALAGQGRMRLVLEVDKTVRPPSDSRDLGLALSRVVVR